MTSRAHWIIVVMLGLSSIGADDCFPAAAPGLAIDPNNFCYTDPPVGCAAYCSAPDVVSVTPACTHISAGPREFEFEIKVLAHMDLLEAQGIRVCPQANLFNFTTPCMVGVPPVQWPNQSECTPPPPGCVVATP